MIWVTRKLPITTDLLEFQGEKQHIVKVYVSVHCAWYTRAL